MANKRQLSLNTHTHTLYIYTHTHTHTYMPYIYTRTHIQLIYKSFERRVKHTIHAQTQHAQFVFSRET